MTKKIVLASASEKRRQILNSAGIALEVRPAAIDELSIRQALKLEGADPKEMATSLAEIKARRVSRPSDGRLTIGCDQILEFEGQSYGKAADLIEATTFLQKLRGKTHFLHSAAVVCEDGHVVWRGIASASLTFRNFSDKFLDRYLQRGGTSLLDSVGCYRIEEEGIRLVAKLSGDIYAVYGLPMTSLLEFLESRGVLEN